MHGSPTCLRERAGVQRDAIPLCWVQEGAPLAGRSALLGSRGCGSPVATFAAKPQKHRPTRSGDQAPWRVEGSRPIGSRVKRLAQGGLMLCVNPYWVLPDAGGRR